MENKSSSLAALALLFTGANAFAADSGTPNIHVLAELVNSGKVRINSYGDSLLVVGPELTAAEASVVAQTNEELSQIENSQINQVLQDMMDRAEIASMRESDDTEWNGN